MDRAFLAAYVDLSIKTCRRRRAHAIGGMSAYIPVKDDEANRIALERVKADKEREVKAGHDGTWVAHPGLVPLAKEIFARIDGPHQISNLRDDVEVTAGDLLAIPAGEVSEKGVRTNVSVGIQYLKAWLDGKGSVPLYNLMEDAATAEICRAQLWQWVRHSARMKDGRRVTPELFDGIAKQELEDRDAAWGGEVHRRPIRPCPGNIRRTSPRRRVSGVPYNSCIRTTTVTGEEALRALAVGQNGAYGGQ